MLRMYFLLHFSHFVLYYVINNIKTSGWSTVYENTRIIYLAGKREHVLFFDAFGSQKWQQREAQLSIYFFVPHRSKNNESSLLMYQ